MDKVGSALNALDILSTEVFCDENMGYCLAVVVVAVLVGGGDSIICRCG